tara:strand:- start:1458 stop:1607 length:150 start_codon:yes stop_codon:yes gene_type:complete
MKRKDLEIIYEKIPVKKNRFKSERKDNFRLQRRIARNSKKQLQYKLLAG